MKSCFVNIFEGGHYDISVHGLTQGQFERLIPAMREVRSIEPTKPDGRFVGIVDLDGNSKMFFHLVTDGNTPVVSIVDRKIKDALDKAFIDSFPKPEDVLPASNVVIADPREESVLFNIISELDSSWPSEADLERMDSHEVMHLISDLRTIANKAFYTESYMRLNGLKGADRCPSASKNLSVPGAMERVLGPKIMGALEEIRGYMDGISEDRIPDYDYSDLVMAVRDARDGTIDAIMKTENEASYLNPVGPGNFLSKQLDNDGVSGQDRESYTVEDGDPELLRLAISTVEGDTWNLLSNPQRRLVDLLMSRGEVELVENIVMKVTKGG